MSREKARSILNNKSELEEFARSRKLAIEAARALLERMLREPELSDEANKYVWSGESSADLKGYASGEEKGYKRGHEAGFAKGAFLGVLAAGSAVAAYLFSKK